MIENSKKQAIVVHGGAGGIPQPGSPEARNQREQMDALGEIINSGWGRLSSGMSALDVVTETVNDLEKALPFNAGDGASLNEDGYIELDAALMEGSTGKFVGLTGIELTRDAILVARFVLDDDDNPHIIYSGNKRALKWNEKTGVALVPPKKTDYRKQRLATILREREQQIGDTVGVIVFDGKDFAAGASTGGTGGKLAGRAGDLIVPGAGIFATKDAAACATGHGESIIYAETSKAAVYYAEGSLGYFGASNAQEAALLAIGELSEIKLKDKPGRGGVLLLNRNRRGELQVGVVNTEDTDMAHAIMTTDMKRPLIRRSQRLSDFS